MFNFLKTVLNQILKENGKYSFTRCMPFAGYILFTMVSLYLVYNRLSWSHYETFAAITGGGSLATQLTNKAINSKYGNFDNFNKSSLEGEGDDPTSKSQHRAKDFKKESEG